MKAVAREMNLSETAFLRKTEENTFNLRWLTPEVEVDLCGHATLASAHALWEQGHADPARPIRFSTRSGWLSARKSEGRIELDFPALRWTEVEMPEAITAAIPAAIVSTGSSRMDLVVELEDEAAVRTLRPDLSILSGLPVRGVIVTARSSTSGIDFVSRFFAPAAGVNEDPVTGSAHCVLAPFWGEKLGKTVMVGYQASARGGTVHVRVDGDRVHLGGLAFTVMKGEILSPHE